jgi:hypothetical protein
MASVFGSNRVPAVHNGSAEVTLNNCIVLKDEPQPDIVVHQSPLNGHRTTIVRGYHWVFEVQLNFWKSASAAALKAWLEDVGETNHRIKRFGDDDYLKKDGSTDCYFTLEFVRSSFLTQSRDKDVIFLRWTSNDYVQLDLHL